MSNLIARRALLAAPAALLMARPALADEKLVPAVKIYAYLEPFLKVPPTERSRVRLDYFLIKDGKPAQGVLAWFVTADGRRTAAPIGADGRLLRIPNLAELQGGVKVAFNLDATAKMGVRLELGPAMHPAQEMEALELARSIDEVNRVIAKAAGAMALVAPKMAQIVCIGAPSGVAVMPNGSTQPLGIVRGSASYNPFVVKGAVKVRLVKAPSRLAFAPAK
ncbi:MAG: hypothetical protein JWP35_596 [Caulobacter sp.]|nr:hypothetical protein [Caulobacter sp.]